MSEVVLFEQAHSSVFFSGFLTLSGFLFTIKTFLVLNMSKEMYGTKEYLIKMVIPRHQIGVRVSVYGPLIRLAKLMKIGIYITLTTAILHCLFGGSNCIYASILCLLMTLTSLAFFIWIIFLFSSNITSYMEYKELMQIDELNTLMSRPDTKPDPPHS